MRKRSVENDEAYRTANLGRLTFGQTRPSTPPLSGENSLTIAPPTSDIQINALTYQNRSPLGGQVMRLFLLNNGQASYTQACFFENNDTAVVEGFGDLSQVGEQDGRLLMGLTPNRAAE